VQSAVPLGARLLRLAVPASVLLWGPSLALLEWLSVFSVARYSAR
jgi:hypothetical protein